MDWPLQSANKQMYTRSYSTYNNFIFYQSLLQQASYIWLMFLKQWLCHVKQHNRILLSLVLKQQFWIEDTHITTGRTWTPHKYTQHTIYCYTQPEGPKNTMTNCICTPHFYITACFNIVINICSMPAMRLKWWVANKSNTLLCHIAHISDITHSI